MRILVLNPNTSQDFTARIEAVARQYAHPSTEILARNPESGPRSIESVYDELLSARGALEVVLAEAGNCDAILMACYSDHPIIAAAREVTSQPVLGIAEATMYVACMVGSKFSIVTTNDEWKPLLWDAVRKYGLTERCASIRTTALPVLALEAEGRRKGYTQILEQARAAMIEDGAEVICLGCAGMAGMDKEMEAALGIPVLDGVACGVKLLEGLVGYGLRTSKRLAFATPRPKELVNLPALLSQAYRQP